MVPQRSQQDGAPAARSDQLSVCVYGDFPSFLASLFLVLPGITSPQILLAESDLRPALQEGTQTKAIIF